MIMYTFYGLDPITAERVNKAQFTPPDNWSGDYQGIKDILDTEQRWSVLDGEEFDFNNPKHIKMLPDIINGVYVWCEKSSKRKIVIKKGGPGSGHFGHRGRQGKIGGSMPSGLRAAKVAGHANIFDGYEGGRLVEDVLTLNVKGGRFINATDEERSLVKSVNVAELSRRTGISEPHVNDILKDWAVSSNDNNLSMLLLQEAAAEELGVEMGDWQKAKLDELYQYQDKDAEWFSRRSRDATMDLQEIDRDWNKGIKAARERGEYSEWYAAHRNEYAKKREAAAALETKYEKEYGLFHAGLYDPGPLSMEQRKSFIGEMYSWTQNDLSVLGYMPDPNEQVTLFRGINRDYLPYKKNDVVSYKGNAIESWSLSDRSAADFAFNSQSGTGLVMAITVPRRNIISTAVTGLGCLSEGEVIISGTIDGHKVRIYDIMQFDEAYDD